MAKFIYAMVVLSLVSMCSGSAIPMWEFLGRTEKMSHLYSMFAKEVSKYCKSNADRTVAKCKHDLLHYGVLKLEEMNESHLDAMDPYQRSATDIIWDSIMDGHPMMASKIQQTTKAPIRQPTGLFAQNPLFDGIDDDVTDKQPIQHKPAKLQQEFGADVTYGIETFEDPKNYLSSASNLDYRYDAPTSNHLIGPMVVRVMPDGSPVAADKTKPLPIDDDRDAMTIGSNGFFPSVQTPSTRLEAPALPNGQNTHTWAQAPSVTAAYTNYRTISRRNQH